MASQKKITKEIDAKETKQSKVKSSGFEKEYAQAFVAGLNPETKKQFGEPFLKCIVDRHQAMTSSRKPGETLIEVYNPTEKKQGWTGAHTVIDVVADDSAFIIDSVIALLSEKTYLIELILHPLLFLERTAGGQISKIHQMRAANLHGESHIFVQLNRRLTESQIDELKAALQDVYKDIALSNRDWKPCKAAVKKLRDSLVVTGKDGPIQQDYLNLLDYIHDDNFTLLGFRSYAVKGSGPQFKLQADTASGLGLLSRDRTQDFISKDDIEDILSNSSILKLPQIYITKLRNNSPVHRRVPVDAVIVRQEDKSGKVSGLTIILGLFTSVTYSRGLNTVPYLRMKAESVMARAGFEGTEHLGRALRHILEKYPRDELFQISEDQLFETCKSILNLQEQPRVALYMRPDWFGRNVMCLIYVPRDLYDTTLRMKFMRILENELEAKCVTFHAAVDDSPLVRISMALAWSGQGSKKFDARKIESIMREVGQSWTERLNDALIEKLSNEDHAADLTQKYSKAFLESYLEMYQARQAVHDIEKIERVVETGHVEVDFYKPYNAGSREVSLKIFSPTNPISLSEILPILENMGLKILAEFPHEIKPAQAKTSIWIQDFKAEIVGILPTEDHKDNIKDVRDQFEACLKGVWAHEIENDSLNRLIILRSIPWRDILILRSCVRYMRQTRIPFSLQYMEQALTDYPEIAKNLIALFKCHFDPSQPKSLQGDKVAAKIKDTILSGLQNVALLDQDRILRSILALIESALRTNFYQKDKSGAHKSWVSIKFDSSKLPDIPDPRPYREIFVYSPRVEGIHLRGGPIARGGLRWSDRHEDFRTEVLSLMKAQQVKNSVIVPMGAKGGFVVKCPPKEGGREAFMKEGVACYQTYIRALLDITDNRVGKKIVPPADVVRKDPDDPYLVVAADKGTATFSDIANAISLEYGFWLGDAFASGGSAGYDHKKMGITARGAWESVKRHFRELNHDTQTKEFDVVGVGDMAGDVFGNGLLQSDKIRLVGAYNHIHIFCDPEPDAASSFKERQRLFNAVKGWDQYDTSKLSKGGRIFLRSEKYLTLTPEIRKRFDITKEVVSPAELIHALLKARTDLLFFGGIGTYIKSSAETAQDAGDRSNDGLRVDATDIRASVIGEGANLAITQRGRIEFARNGGRINTDFIDNSAGVDTSDHEVNIKILLSEMIASDKVLTPAARNKLLSEMTEDVAQLVLQDNYQQSQAISLLEMQAADLLPSHAAFMVSLEKAGLLNRRVEFLPDDDQIAERLHQHKGLTRPELSLIVSYGKLTLTKALLASDIPDQPGSSDWLVNYFPERLRKKYLPYIEKHQLRREIIAMSISNAIVNRMGPTFVRMTAEKTGASIADVVTAYMTVRHAFGLKALWTEIEYLDNKVPASVQLKGLYKVAKLAERETYWILTRLGRSLRAGKDQDLFLKGISTLKDNVEKALPKDIMDHVLLRRKVWMSDGLPKDLARQISLLPILAAGFDLVKISELLKKDLMQVAQIYFSIGSAFHLEKLRTKAMNLSADTPQIAAAAQGLVDSLYAIQSDLATRVVRDMGGKSVKDDVVTVWIEKFCPQAHKILSQIEDLEQTGQADLAALVVIDQGLRRLM